MRCAPTLAATLLPTAALAHPGLHGGVFVAERMAHALRSADHLALGLGALVSPGLIYRRFRSHK